VQPKSRDSRKVPAPPTGSGREETHAFIVRLHISVAGEKGTRRTRFSVEDVARDQTIRFATFALVTAHLAERIRELACEPGA